MKFPIQPNFNGATIFTIPAKMDDRDAGAAGPLFTDSNTSQTGDPIRPYAVNPDHADAIHKQIENMFGVHVTNGAQNVTEVTGRTLNGERVPPGRDDSKTWEPLTPKDREWIEAWIPDNGERRKVDQDVPHQEMLRSVESPQPGEKSQVEDMDPNNRKINGQD